MNVEIIYLADSVTLVVPPDQEGVDFKTAAAKLTELARTLAVELQLPVTIEGIPEQHLRGDEHERVHAAGITHGH